MSLSRSMSAMVLVSLVMLTSGCAYSAHSRGFPPGCTGFRTFTSVYVSGDRAVPRDEPLCVPGYSGKPVDKRVPTPITWVVNGDAPLKVTPKNGNGGPDCNGAVVFRPLDQACPEHSGMCHYKTNPLYAGPWPAKCQYEVWIEGQTQPYDPVIIVDDCCATDTAW